MPRISAPSTLMGWLLVALMTSCRAPASVPSDASTTSAVSVSVAAPPSVASSASGARLPTTGPAPLVAPEPGRLFRELSEPGEYFFSDNVISNETSYLQVADELAASTPGGVYLGVGPEQNFTYLALTRPSLAFLIDIRRDNALLHWLYQAAFAAAKTRAELIAILLGRPYDATGDPEATGDVRAVLAHATRNEPDALHQRTTHDRLVAWLDAETGAELDPRDRETLRKLHEAFFKGQLTLTFTLHEANGRRYPTLRELLEQRDVAGVERSFLASAASYATVRDLQRAHRVIPVVGDFAGTHALAAVGAEVRRRQLTVRTFYVSNVEQYLMSPEKWSRWVANLEALPFADDARFVRCYLDQGRRHPRQLPGHRTATLVQSVTSFRARRAETEYRRFWELVTEP